MKRNCGIDFLKIIAAMMVVILHYYNGNIGGALGFVNTGSINSVYLKLLESISCCAVNTFVVISGYYLSCSNMFQLRKIITLLLQVICLKVLFQIIFIITGLRTIQLKTLIVCLLPTDYYIILYLVLYFLHPIINRLICNISKNEHKKIMAISMFIFSFYAFFIECLENIFGESIASMSPVAASGSSAGYTIINFILIYFIAAYINRYNINVLRRISISVFAISTAFVFGMSVFFGGKAWSYNNPLVIIQAVSLFMAFKSLSFNNVTISRLSKASLTCYIIQGYILRYCRVELFVNKSIFILIFHQILVLVGIYFVSFIMQELLDRFINLFIYKINFKEIDRFLNINNYSI